jgi:hypothetical protein
MYKCFSNFTCGASRWGTWNSSADCRKNCTASPAPGPILTQYRCDNITCVAAADGNFTNKTACDAECGIPELRDGGWYSAALQYWLDTAVLSIQ